MERNEPTTGEIIHELTALLPPMTNYAESICAEGAFAHSTYMVWDEPEPYIIKRAIDRLEQQEQRITELERELAAAKEDITSIAKQSVDDFEKRAWTPPCRFCVKFEECDFIPTDGGCCFEWRGAREGEGSEV